MVGRLLLGFVRLNLQFSGSRLATFSGVRVAQSLVFCVIVRILLVGFVYLNFQFSASWLGDFQWGSCGSNFSCLCQGRQTFSGVRVAPSLVFCGMVGRLLLGFVRLNLQFSGSRLATFSGVRVAQSLLFCLMVGRVDFQWVRVAQYLNFCVMIGGLLVGFVWLNLLFSVSWLVDFQGGSCGSIFSFLCHGLQTFSGLRVAQSLVFCVIVGRLLVGFVLLNLQFSVSLQVDFQWGSCGPIFSFLCHGWQTFSGIRVAQSLVFCVMVGRLLVGLVWLNIQFSVSWLVDFQWCSCGSNFSFVFHGRQTFSGFVRLNLQFSVSRLATCSRVRVAQSLPFCLMVGRVDFQWVRVAQYLNFCVMIGGLLVGFVWLNLQFSVSLQVDFQWASCCSIFSFLCHCRQIFSGVRVAQSLVFFVMVGRLLVGFVWLNLQSSVLWQVDFQWGWCGSIFSFLCHGWQTFSGVRVAQTLVFCFMVGRLLVGFVRLNLQFSVSRLATCSRVRVAQSLVSCLMVRRLLVGFVRLNLQFSVSWLVEQTFSGVRVSQSFVFCVMVGRLLGGFVWLNLLFSVSWLVDFQWGSCGLIFSFLRHCSHTFSGFRVSQFLVFCVMVGRLLVGFVWLKLQLSVSRQVDFQWGSCSSIFSFLWHGWQTFSGVREAQSLVFWVKVGDFQWDSCGSIFTFLSHGWQSRLLVGSCGSIFKFLCHDWWTFSWVRVAQSFVFCVMVGRLLVGFVWLNLQFSVSWLVDFQWASCGSIFSFLCHCRQTFSGLRVAQSLVFCVIVGRFLVGFVWPNLQFSLSWLVDFQWDSCGSIFSLLCYGRQTFSGVGVAQYLVFCFMVGRLLVGFVRLNLQFSVSRLATCSRVREAQSLVFCLMVGRLLVGFERLNLQFCVSWLVDFQWGSCGSIFSFLRHGWETFRGVRVAQTLVFCVMVGRFSVGLVWLNLYFSVSWLVEQTFSGFVWLNIQISVS